MAARARARLSAAELREELDVLTLLRSVLGGRGPPGRRLGVGGGEESDLDTSVQSSAVKSLENEVEEKNVSFQNKSLALQRMQVTDALKNKVKQNDSDSRPIMETMEHIVKLSREIIESQQEAREKEQKLIDIKRKRLSLKTVQEKKMVQILSMMKNQKAEQTSVEVKKKLEEKRNCLRKERALTTIIQNVFQNIIIGSRVNWAENPSLKAIILQLEKDVHLL
ncbi:centromere protein H [Aegotheles albertisi]